MVQVSNSINFFSSEKWVVSTVAGEGTHTTLSNALSSATSGDTVFIMPGTYTENPTFKAGVNVCCNTCDGYTPNVTILGNCTFSGSGSVTVSGINFATNAGNNITVSGSNASQLYLVNCVLSVTNNNGLVFSSSSSSSLIKMFQCYGIISSSTATNKFFSHSSAGTMFMYQTEIRNPGGTTSASTLSGTGELDIYQCRLFFPITTSSTATFDMKFTSHDCSAINTLPLTIGATGSQKTAFCYFNCGTASAVSVSASCTLQMSHCWFQSSATDVLTGAGTLNYSALSFFQGTTQAINTTTAVGGLLQGGINQAPSAGFIGEHISSATTGVSLTNTTPATITSINLTAGVWDLNLQFQANNTSNVMTAAKAGFSTTAATFAGNSGDQFLLQVGSVENNIPITLTNFRVVLTSTTTYYLIGQQNFPTGTGTGDGRISATRVG